MLELLRIRDLALIEDMELEFSPGLNVLSGETGAGKSFILKALTFLTGDRISLDLVRPDKEKAVAEACFTLPGGEELILRRELAAETGRSRIFLADRLISQDAARDLRPSLLLHTGQHGRQQLLQPAFHMRVLDEYMNRPELQQELAALLRGLKDTASRKKELEGRIASLAEKRDMLEFQQQEIAKVDPKPGEEDALEQERLALKTAAENQADVEDALALLRGNGEGAGMLDALIRMERCLKSMARADERFAPHVTALEEFHISASELDSRLRHMRAKPSAEADRERIEARLFALAQLKRKLRRSFEQILSLRDEIAENLSFLDSCELDKKKLYREEQTLCASLAMLLAELNPARKNAAGKLAAAIEEELRLLGFSEHVRVAFAFNPTSLFPDREDCMEEKGLLLWQPNPGLPQQPLDKIASGGELSRFLLALVSLMSRQSDENPTLIFDEVDSGVGGHTLLKVADSLAKLAESRQIILITHWPQLAARAQRHFLVRKEVRSNDTYTLCERLRGTALREEISRMAGGGDMGEALAGKLLRSEKTDTLV